MELILKITIYIAALFRVECLSIVPIPEPGIYFDHIGTLLLKKGAWETTFHTGTRPENDTDTLQMLKKHLTIVLNSVNSTDSEHSDLKVTLQRECNHAIQLIQGISHKRTKRSRGIFGILKDFMFGGDDIDEQLAAFRAAEDTKITHVSERLTQTNKKHNELTENLRHRIDKLYDGIDVLSKKFKHNKNEVLTKYIQETIMLTTALVQDMINKYHEIDSNQLYLEDEEMLKQTIRRKMASHYNALEYSEITNRRIENGEIVFSIKNVIVSIENYEMFKVIAIPNFANYTILDIHENTIAINETSYLYPKEIVKLNESHYISSEKIIQREPDCIASALLHTESGTRCSSKEIGPEVTEFIQLTNPNSILFFSTNPDKILLKCNKTLTTPSCSIGIITLSLDCSILTSKFEIQPTMLIKSEQVRAYFKPMLNLSISKEDKSNEVESVTSNYVLFSITILSVSITVILVSAMLIKKYLKQNIGPPPCRPPTLNLEL
uniref:uncharacterized protein LOC125907472 n=1 Tax=Anopheles coluzzii TaxID=1518534 RepID=UPI0020FF91AA|nr:uncharacterized protein LOC125907472 [Anopheles coluzzii]